MKVTWVGVKLIDGEDRLKAEADVEFDHEFVVHYAKVVEANGRVLVCMPSHRNRYPCSNCKRKIEIDLTYCGWCGVKMDATQYAGNRLYGDACHPIVPELRSEITGAVLEEYRRQLETSKEGTSNANQ